MKVLIVSPYFYPDNKVGALRMSSLALYLKKKGVEVTVAKNFSEEKLEYGGIDVIQIQEGNSFLECMICYSVALIKNIKRGQYDICIISVGPFYTLLCGLIVKVIFGLPYIIDIRDLWYNERIKTHITVKKWIEMLVLGNAIQITTVSTGLVNFLEKRYKGIVGKITSILNGSECNIKRSERQEGLFRIGIFGKFSYYNQSNVDELLKALKSIDAEFEIIHVGSYEDNMIKALENSHLPSSCYKNTGLLNYSEGMEIISKVDCALINADSTTLGYGTKVFDYVCLNLPILLLSKPRTELANLVESFENGFVACEAEAIAQILNYIIERTPLKLGEAIDLEKYKRSKQNEIYYQLLMRIIKK